MSKQNKLAVLGVMHPHAEPYAADFFASLAAQRDADFELFLLMDGCPGFTIPEAAGGMTVRIRETGGTVSAIRKDGLRWLGREGIHNALLVDADDTFAPDRVGECRRLLKNEAVVFNELAWVSDSGEPVDVLSKRFSEGERIGSEVLLDANCLGMTHTALRVADAVAACERVPDNAPVFDWAFFTRVLAAGNKAYFTSRTRTFYRLSAAGHAPLNCVRDEAALLRAVRLKRDHYAGCADLGPEYAVRRDEFGRLDVRLNTDAVFLKKYAQAVRDRCPAEPLWWEPIRTEKELGL